MQMRTANFNEVLFHSRYGVTSTNDIFRKEMASFKKWETDAGKHNKLIT